VVCALIRAGKKATAAIATETNSKAARDFTFGLPDCFNPYSAHGNRNDANENRIVVA